MSAPLVLEPDMKSKRKGYSSEQGWDEGGLIKIVSREAETDAPPDRTTLSQRVSMKLDAKSNRGRGQTMKRGGMERN